MIGREEMPAADGSEAVEGEAAPPAPSPGSPDGLTEGEVVDGEVVDDQVVEGESEPKGPPLTPLEQAVAERNEYLDAMRRLQADFENYRKRMGKQLAEEAARGALGMVDKMLPVLDTLDQAAAHLGDPDSADGRALVAVSSQLTDVLTKAGLERLDPAGLPFDPTAHEAVGHLPAEPGPADPGSVDPGADGDTGDDGPVVGQVMRAGYRWKGTVVRPAMVMVRG